MIVIILLNDVLPILLSLGAMKVKIPYQSYILLGIMLFIGDYISIYFSTALDALIPPLMILLFMIRQYDLIYSVYIATIIMNVFNILHLITPFLYKMNFLRIDMPFIQNLIISDIFVFIIAWLVNLAAHRLIQRSRRFRLVLALTSFNFYVYFAFIHMRLVVLDDFLTRQHLFVVVMALMLLLTILALAIEWTYHRYQLNRQEQFAIAANQEYLREIQQQYQHLRAIDHDYRNMMIALDHYVTHQETDALYQFAREMLSDYQGHAATVQRQEAGLLDLKPADIQQVLAVKLHQARQLGVDIQLEVEGPMTLQVTDHLGMIRVLGILLDNATEAASQCDAGRVRLALIQWADQQVVVIMNTYAGDLDLTKILFQADYTTKGPGHGQGLVNVHQLLINSPWELVTSVEGHWFKQELIRTMDQKGGR